MKKLSLAVIIAFITSCLLVSCGGSSSQEASNSEKSSVSKSGSDTSEDTDDEYSEGEEDDDDDDDWDSDDEDDSYSNSCCKIDSNSELFEQPIENESDQEIYDLLQQYAGDGYDNTWNIGSARKLQGKTYVLELWLTEQGTLWNKQEMGRIQYEIDRALEWLKSVAKRYGKTLSFELGSFHGDGQGVVMKSIPHSYEDYEKHPDLILEALQVIGYTGVEQCYNQLKKMGDGFDNVLCLVLLNHEGRSYANSFSRGHVGYYETQFLEGVVIFKSYGQEGLSTANVFAHEILHTFGAWDMYGDAQSGKSQEAEQFANQYYPTEIMGRGADAPFDQIQISPLTAWLTGLSDEYDEWYWYFMSNYGQQ